MEIERKFLISDFPSHLKELERADMYQGYLSVSPVVRIRKKVKNNESSYKLCIKGKGTLVREEVEFPISEDEFTRLSSIIDNKFIHKEYRTYKLGEYTLECSKVDFNNKNVFYYAEIEFKSVEDANAFTPPDFLNNEVTEKSGYTMKDYWERNI